MEKVDNRGGYRPGSGRKTTGQKKKPVTLYIEEGQIWKFGTVDNMKNKIYGFIGGYGIDKPTATLQDLTKSNVEIKVFEQPKTNYVAQVIPPVPLPTGDNFEEELAGCKSYAEVEKVIRKIKSAGLPVWKQKQLEKIAMDTIKQKGFYNE